MLIRRDTSLEGLPLGPIQSPPAVDATVHATDKMCRALCHAMEPIKFGVVRKDLVGYDAWHTWQWMALLKVLSVMGRQR